MTGNGSFVAALLDSNQVPPAGIKAWNGSDPTRRFNVHRNNVFVSLIEALATTFPVSRALVGEAFFRAMARIFVSQSPPDSRLLAEYGRSFPDFVAAFPPAGGLPYLADVSRLEYLRVEASHAADAVAIDREAFRSLQEAPERLLAQRMHLHPACRLLRSSHSAFSIWAAHQGALAIESVRLDRPEDILVFRPDHEVLMLTLPPGGASWLSALAGQATLAEATAQAAEDPGFDLVENFGLLIANRLIVKVTE